ncbi:MAG: tetratricopeptide repeat protein [Acidobacteriota bacterium]
MSRRAPVRGPGRRALTLAACGALLLAILVQQRIEAGARDGTGPSPLLYLPSGRYLRVVSLGFDELLADVLYLWAIQYYGNYRVADRYDYLENIFDRVISELDPHYIDPYLIGALIMTSEARSPEMALRLLDKGIEKNPDEWILAFEAGFTCYNDLQDYRRAATYFKRALRAPGVHPLVRRFYASMRERAGDREASLREWAEIYDTAADERVRRVAWNHVHDLKVEIDLRDLRGAVGRFRVRRARLPRHLGELTPEDGIARLPRDPEGRDYLYERASGRVSYHGRLVLAR